MARKRIHTCPEKAGIQNFPEGYEDKHKDEDMDGEAYLGVMKKSFENRENYKGLWTEETMTKEIDNYFQYCFEKDLKPCKAGLALWLGTYKQQIWEWEKFPEKYGFKSDLMKQANTIIEMTYVKRAEKYPTANIFLLKSSHGYAETTNVNITGEVSKEDIAKKVIDLGLKEKQE